MRCMSDLSRLGLVGLAAGSMVALGVPAFGAEVTADRLLGAQGEPQNWLLPYGSYNNHYSSRLSQINRSNVGNLQVKFMHAIGGTSPSEAGGAPPAQQAVPAVDGGYMYVHNPWGQVIKIDVRGGNRGTTVWRADAEPELTGTMRGMPALLGNNVFINTRDSNLLKIDANSGEIAFEVSFKAPEEEAGRLDQRPSIQPLALKDRVIVATTGTVRRNFVAAYTADEGELMWRFWTIPGPGEFGHESWGGDWNAYITGGAAVWTQGAYDPETELFIVGTGEPSPWYDPEFRPGDNLFSVSSVAINVDSGELGWYFQEIPDESWDYDTVNPKMLYDITVDGALRKVQGTYSRNGYYYTLDRTSGEFLMASAYVPLNWTAGLDPKTGMPVEYDPSKAIQSYAPGMSMRAGQPETSQNVCPSLLGAPTLMPPTFDSQRMVAYVGAAYGCFSQSLEEGYERADIWRGKTFAGRETIYGDPVGKIWAIDVRTGATVIESTEPYPLYSGTLGTAGDLLFIGHLDGKFAAYDKDTLAELWAFNTGTPIAAPAITYSVDGHQYVAVVGGGTNLHMGRWNFPDLDIYQLGNAQVVVFGL